MIPPSVRRALTEWSLVVLAVISSTAAIARARGTQPFDASFIQINASQFEWDAAAWRGPLQQICASGADLVVVQFSGADRQSYDSMAKTGPGTVTALLEAASGLGLHVMMGLHSDSRWPARFLATDRPAPLDDPETFEKLAAACRRSGVFDGWYVPEEADDTTWSTPEATERLRAFFAETSARLRAAIPGAQIAVAPFHAGGMQPRAHAAWWDRLLDGAGIDVLMLQDGVGVRRDGADSASAYLRALWPVLRRRGVHLWAVIELFHQIHGEPFDQEPFAARPAPLVQVLASLAAERRYTQHAVAFTVLDYMNADGGEAQAHLRGSYLGWLRGTTATATGRPSKKRKPARAQHR